jgi:signal transduction histidine kinase
VFSQQMMENLINDLMDHAKMENNSFKFDNDYFNLSSIIYEALQMLNFSASERDIQLRAQIDREENLDLI